MNAARERDPERVAAVEKKYVVLTNRELAYRQGRELELLQDAA